MTVEVRDGTATLSGTVSYPSSRIAAERDAAFTQGVTDVQNEIALVV
jgi:osmotically-inducible protein OsmY